MEFRMAKHEALFRICALLLLILSACLVHFNTQTKLIFGTIKKKATYKDMDALKISSYIDAATAGYYLLQLCRHYALASGLIQASTKSSSNIVLIWSYFLLDQVAVYLEFAGNSARIEGSLLAVTGAKELQWMKVCDRFTRFCHQIGVAIVASYSACVLMALVSIISAYNLFKLYMPNVFMHLKRK